MAEREDLGLVREVGPQLGAAAEEMEQAALLVEQRALAERLPIEKAMRANETISDSKVAAA